MPGGEVPFRIEVFKKNIPQHSRTVVLPAGQEVRFKQVWCPGSGQLPAEIWVEHETLCAMCVKQYGTAIEWDQAGNDWVVR